MTDTPDRPPKTATDASNRSRYRHRFGEFTATRFPYVLVALLLLAAIGAGVTYATHVSPGEQTEREVVGTWSDRGQFEHAATVQRDTEVFANGTVLDDRSTYFTRVSPELDIGYTYRNRVTEPAAARTNLSLVVRSIDENGGVFWQTSERLDRASSEALAAGDRQTVAATVNVTRVRNRIRQIETDLGASPGETSIRIVATTSVNATVGGEQVVREREDALAIVTEDGTYDVTDESAGRSTDDVTTRRTVPAEYGPLRSLGGPLLSLSALVAAAVLGWARHTGRLAVDPQRRRRRAVRRERDEFDDWITLGRLPEELADRTVVETESLVGLVDVAIDSDRRVVEDRSTGLFAVLDGEVAYTFEPPGTDLVPVDDSVAGSGGDATGTLDSESNEDPTADTDDASKSGPDAERPPSVDD